MPRLKALTRKHARLSLALVVFALAVKALLPAGFMVSAAGERFLTVTICADASGTPKQMQIAIQDKDDIGGDHSEAADKGQPCAFSGLGHAGLGGVDPVLLAAALAFILLAGFAPPRAPALRDIAFLRPPLRGPPSPTT
jgi:hypothetical protein